MSAKEKIKLVVVDEHTLGYVVEQMEDRAFVLHQSILKGAPWQLHPHDILLSGRKVRLASEKDFEDYRVCFEGYKDDPIYEYVYAK